MKLMAFSNLPCRGYGWRPPIVLLTALFISLAASSGIYPAESAETGSMEMLRAKALGLVNEDRRQHGLETLDFTEPLNEAAQGHAVDMRRRDFYAHVSPEGETVKDRYSDHGGSRWRLVAENIARCTGCPSQPTDERVKSLHTGWMKSPPHRRNILMEGLDSFGFGIVVGKDNVLYAVQTFAGPGTARELQPGEKPVALSPAEQAEQMVMAINKVRQREGLPPLKQSGALVQATMVLLPDNAGALLRFDPNVRLYEALPENQEDNWAALSVLAASCGGCGTLETAADIRSFREQWLENPQYADTLLDAAFTHLGFAMRTDGEGKKVAVAVLGRQR